MGDVEFAVLVTRLEDDAYDLGEVGCSNVREIETLGQRIDETKAAMFAHINALRAAVRAADAMARALLDKSSGAHECNGGPERCWYCADAESDRAVVSAFDQARAKCGEVT